MTATTQTDSNNATMITGAIMIALPKLQKKLNLKD